MNYTRDNIVRFCSLAFLAVTLLALTLTATAQTPDYKKIWTTVGSAGTVDEADTAKTFFDKSVVQLGKVLILQPGAQAAEAAPTPMNRVNTIAFPMESAVVRYNITPVDGLFPDAGTRPAVEMKLRYLDTGSAQVVAKLIEVDLATGAETVRLTFDSNKFAGANGYQVNSITDCLPSWRFDFVNKGYYVEATLTHSAFFIGSAAGISLIKVQQSSCIF